MFMPTFRASVVVAGFEVLRRKESGSRRSVRLFWKVGNVVVVW